MDGLNEVAFASANLPAPPDRVEAGDRLVGTENCAPPEWVAWWVPDPPLEPAHIVAYHDRRLLADIARRLRGEPPFTVGTPAPYPGPG